VGEGHSEGPFPATDSEAYGIERGKSGRNRLLKICELLRRDMLLCTDRYIMEEILPMNDEQGIARPGDVLFSIRNKHFHCATRDVVFFYHHLNGNEYILSIH